jgi:hypothetical protein
MLLFTALFSAENAKARQVNCRPVGSPSLLTPIAAYGLSEN